MAEIGTILPTDWEAPQRGVDSQSVFRIKANNAWVKLRNDIIPKVNQWSTEANLLRDDVNNLQLNAGIKADLATTQAGIATTKASEATQKASEASSSANQALTYKNQIQGYVIPAGTSYSVDQINTQNSAMTKAQFNALAEERKANRAGSGFDGWGRHHASVTFFPNINEGMWATTEPANSLYLGKETATSVGASKSQYPIVNINGVVQKIKGSSIVENTDRTLIKLPTVPNIYSYDTVLTAEQVASGVIKHADASNSGLIVNGKFDTDTSGWTSSNGGVISYINGNLQITKTGSGLWQGAKQTIPTVIGKKYVVEATISESISATAAVYAIATGNIVTSASASRVTLEFIATAVTSEIFLSFNSASGAEGSVLKFDNVAVYPADTISRSDLVFLELTTSNAA